MATAELKEGRQGSGRYLLPPISPLLQRRLLTAIPTILVIVTLTFILCRVAPGGPFRNERVVPDAVKENIEARYGLDRPFYEQYVRFWTNLLTGNLGPSFQQPERSAFGVLFSGAGASLIVGFAALFVALLLGVGGGTLAVVSPRASPVVSTAALVALAVPVFVLGPLLIQLLAVSLGLLPAALWGSPAHVVMPALTLGIPVGGALARFWRAVLGDNMECPECMAARARGLTEWGVVRRHAAPRSLPLLLNYIGPMLVGLVTGSVVVEKIFGIPGMGRYFIDGAVDRDYPVVIGATLIYAFTLLLVHTVIDLSHLRLDPRLKKEHTEWTEAEKDVRRRLQEAARIAREKRKEEARLKKEEALQEKAKEEEKKKREEQHRKREERKKKMEKKR